LARGTLTPTKNSKIGPPALIGKLRCGIQNANHG
jgi:hypothetical protein